MNNDLSQEELNEVFRLHKLWTEGAEGGVRCDLSDKNLKGVTLEDVNLDEALLRYTDFSNATLDNVSMYDANLTCAKFNKAKLTNVTLRFADLSSASMLEAELIRVDMSLASLEAACLNNGKLNNVNCTGVDFTDADLTNTEITNTDLNYAVGNNNEIKTIQTGTWIITHTNKEMAIGCQQHSFREWFSFNDEEINLMHEDALEFWKKWKPILQSIIGE